MMCCRMLLQTTPRLFFLQPDVNPHTTCTFMREPHVWTRHIMRPPRPPPPPPQSAANPRAKTDFTRMKTKRKDVPYQ